MSYRFILASRTLMCTVSDIMHNNSIKELTVSVKMFDMAVFLTFHDDIFKLTRMIFNWL